MGSGDENKFCSILKPALPTVLVSLSLHTSFRLPTRQVLVLRKLLFSRRDVENLDSEIAGVEKNLDPGPGVVKVLFPGFFFPREAAEPRGASQGGRRAGLEEEALRV